MKREIELRLGGDGVKVLLRIELSDAEIARLAPGLSPDDIADCKDEIALHLAQQMPALLAPAHQSICLNLHSALNRFLTARVNEKR